jgi:hypothetical protein
VLAGWLRKLEPLGHGNPEPIFVARNARLLAPPRIMKERHLRLELAQDPSGSSRAFRLVSARNPIRAPAPAAAIRAVGWNLAERAMELASAGQPHRPRLPHPRKRPPRLRRSGVTATLEHADGSLEELNVCIHD